MNARAVATAVCLLLGAAGLTRVADGAGQAPAGDDWRQMKGTWSAMGRRQTLPTETGHVAAIMQFSGAVVLTAGDGLSRGFRGEFIGFDDGGAIASGRFVWTDERGDRVFGVVRGDPVQTGRRFAGTITGGTGRYAGISGEYEFTWQSVVEAEGIVQGRTTDIKGRYRRGGGRP